MGKLARLLARIGLSTAASRPEQLASDLGRVLAEEAASEERAALRRLAEDVLIGLGVDRPDARMHLALLEAHAVIQGAYYAADIAVAKAVFDAFLVHSPQEPFQSAYQLDLRRVMQSYSLVLSYARGNPAGFPEEMATVFAQMLGLEADEISNPATRLVIFSVWIVSALQAKTRVETAQRSFDVVPR